MEGALLPPSGIAGSVSHTGLTRELALLVAGGVVYFGGRELVQGSRSAAVRDAEWIIELEQRLGVDVERRAQEAVVGSDLLRTVGNLSYVWLHWPLLLVILGVLFVRDRWLYRRLRDAMFASGAFALAIFAVFPVAPPRFMPGFVGTVSDDARRHYLAFPLSWSNPYAAFPSFHVGWTLIACLALASATTRRRHAVFALVPAALVGLAVVTTGNHYLVDAFGGATIALVAYWWFGRRDRAGDAGHGGRGVHPATSNEYASNSVPRQSRPESVTTRWSPRSSTVTRPNCPLPGSTPSL